MKNGTEFIPSGSVTSPEGFQAGATGAGIKKKSGLDLGILSSEAPCAAAGVFTTNRVKAAPVILCQQRLRNGKARAVVVNSGCANACTGERGLVDGTEMAELAAGVVGAAPEEVLVASTGVIGQPLPMARLRAGMGRITFSRDGGHELARAIMTTDTMPKEAAVGIEGSGAIIGGVVKGSGMIHPDLATLLCFLTTDAAITKPLLTKALKLAIGNSLNKLTVDIHQSTNDTAIILASALAGNPPIKSQCPRYKQFKNALIDLCDDLARQMALDAEGATRMFKVLIKNAATKADAAKAARAIADYPLVKCAINGSDPNWGRIICAVGSAGIKLNPARLSCKIADITVFKNGAPKKFDAKKASKAISQKEHTITVDLGVGHHSDFCYGCDMSKEYVAINADYHT